VVGEIDRRDETASCWRRQILFFTLSPRNGRDIKLGSLRLEPIHPHLFHFGVEPHIADGGLDKRPRRASCVIKRPARVMGRSLFV